jgi:hypothetical protein
VKRYEGAPWFVYFRGDAPEKIMSEAKRLHCMRFEGGAFKYALHIKGRPTLMTADEIIALHRADAPKKSGGQPAVQFKERDLAQRFDAAHRRRALPRPPKPEVLTPER